jgi:hypothetical protein
MVAWTGGYEDPEYAFFNTEEAAWAKHHEWCSESEHGVHSVQIVKIEHNDDYIAQAIVGEWP